jgi:hypothetical protein
MLATRRLGAAPEEPTTMQQHSIADFIAAHADQERNAGLFEVENPMTLQVNLRGTVYAKAGAMVAYRGDVKFSRKGVLEDGVGKLFKKVVTGEGATLMKMEGNARVYLADSAKCTCWHSRARASASTATTCSRSSRRSTGTP